MCFYLFVFGVCVYISCCLPEVSMLDTTTVSQTEGTTSVPPKVLFDQLCDYPVTTCEDRQNKRLAKIKTNSESDSPLYVACELQKVSISCVEDYICFCPGMQRPDLAQMFDEVKLTYIRNCTNVEKHAPRTAEIRCKGMIQGQSPEPTDPDKAIVLGEIRTDFEFSALVREVDRACPGFENCYNITRTHNHQAMALTQENAKRATLCQNTHRETSLTLLITRGSRLNILCLEDVLCSCLWPSPEMARTSIRSLRHNHEQFCDEDLTIGYLNCAGKSVTEKAGELCTDFFNTCERRVISRYQNMSSRTEYRLLSCETYKIRVQCLEDHVCTCTGKQTDSLKATFDSYKTLYETQCSQVLGHRVRTGDIYCEGKIESGPGHPGLELGTDLAILELTLADQAWKLDKDCPACQTCFNLSATYSKMAASQTTLAGQLAVSCEGSKFTVICLEDALCQCGLGNEPNFLSDMRSLRHRHEITCKEDLTIGFLACNECVTLSRPWFQTVIIVTLSIISQLLSIKT